MPQPTVSPTAPSGPAARGRLRAVALPTEHGGWGLTLEPGLLGLLVAPSLAGTCLALAALVAFAVRTPLKLALVDRRRGRSLPRTALAWRVASIELAVLAALVVGALRAATAPFWGPALIAAPLVGLEAWFDVRSRSRRLVPELAGAVGVCAVAPMVVLADGGRWVIAVGLWLVLAARSLSSIPHVRAQVERIHGRAPSTVVPLAGDLLAVAVAATAALVDGHLVAGALAVLALVAVQRITAGGRPVRAVVLGIRQMAFGLAVVVVTAIGASGA